MFEVRGFFFPCFSVRGRMQSWIRQRANTSSPPSPCGGLPVCPAFYSELRVSATEKAKIKRLSGRTGMRRRAAWLGAHPLCVGCMSESPARYVPATVVDHVVALVNGGADDETNLQSLCGEHHRIKTARDMGYRPHTGASIDGWPTNPDHPWSRARAL